MVRMSGTYRKRAINLFSRHNSSKFMRKRNATKGNYLPRPRERRVRPAVSGSNGYRKLLNTRILESAHH